MNKKKWKFILALDLFCMIVWIFYMIILYSIKDFKLLTILSGIAALAWIGRTVYDICKYSAESKEWKTKRKVNEWKES